MRVNRLNDVIIALIVGNLIKNSYDYSIHFFEKGLFDFWFGLIPFIILAISIKWKNKTIDDDFLVSFILLVLSISVNNILYISQIYSDIPIYILYLILILSGFGYGLKSTSMHSLLLLPFGLICCFILPEKIIIGMVLLLTAVQRANLIKWSIVVIVSVLLLLYLPEIHFYDSQKNYFDPVVYSVETGQQKIDITQWKEDYWFYSDGKNQFSSADYHMYYEPMAHLPLLYEKNEHLNILILGGENGLLANEILKYDSHRITIIPYDKDELQIAKNNRLYTKLNNESLSNSNLKIINNSSDLFRTLHSINDTFDIVFADLPDPFKISTSRLYSVEFYKMIYSKLINDGKFITQSGNPYSNSETFLTIGNTLTNAGFNSLAFHNQVPTIGEWSWYFCSKNDISNFSKSVLNQNISVETIFLNKESINALISFGKAPTSHNLVNHYKSPTIIETMKEHSY